MAGPVMRVLVAATLLLATIPSTAGAQVSGASRPLSATVVATYVVRSGDLTVLVLWRGSPGWYARGGGRSSGGGGGGGSARETASFYATFGNLTLTVDVDYGTRRASVNGQTVSLTDTNVVLVDDIDRPTGGRIVDRRWVDPVAFEGAAADRSPLLNDPAVAAARRSPNLGDFLQCEIPLPPPGGDGSAPPVADPAAIARIQEYMQRIMVDVCRTAAGADLTVGR